jgi:hypothetical protein
MTAHMSLLCSLRHDDPDHRPCSGVCDGHGSGELCDEQCECYCHIGWDGKRRDNALH